MVVVFIHGGNVIEHVFLFFIHATQAVVNNHGQFISKGGVIGHAIGNERGVHLAVTIFMLQPFAIEGGAPRGAAN